MLRHVIPAMAAILILLGVSTLSRADTTPAATTQPATVRMEKLKAALAKLDLSSTQKEKIKTILNDAKTKLEALKSSAGGATLDKAQARQIIKDALEKAMATLTPAQKAKLREMYTEKKAGSTTQP